MRAFRKKKPEQVAGRIKKVAEYKSNAIGWAKTHHLMILPVQPRPQASAVARQCRLHSQPLYASADPAWICATEAIAAMHPKDPERFPILEKIINDSFEREVRALEAWGDCGFVDYAAGPHYRIGCPRRRYGVTYTIREDLWRAYARSGDRRIRAFCEASDGSYMNNYFAHWYGDGRIRGLYTGADKPSLPFYWGGKAATQKSSKTNFQNFMWMYYLTGHRRAKDHILEYADGIKKIWSPGRARQEWRMLMTMRLIVQAYGFTWDPELRAMADATAELFVDREGAIGLTKNRPLRSSTYKTNVDVRALIEAWETIGNMRYYNAAMKVSRYWWEQLLGRYPLIYCNPQGLIGSFLYKETGDPHYAEGLAVQLRQIATMYDPETKEVARYGRAACTFVYEGIPHAQAVVVAADGLKKHVASWVGYEDFGFPSSIAVRKPDMKIVRVDVKMSGGFRKTVAGAAGGLRLAPIKQIRTSGQTFNRIVQASSNMATACLAKDSAEGGYEIVPHGGGAFFALTHSKVPLVVHAPSYWKPQSKGAPTVRWYFNLPRDSRDTQIFFEGTAKLFDPQGRPLEGGKLQHGWVNLPADRPGLWSFEPVLNMLVRVRNLPPFFAADDPNSYFTPQIPWHREETALRPPQRISPKTVYVPGVIDSFGNQALCLTGRRRFRLEAGKLRSPEEGGQFLPFKKGSIEFYMKPNWSTFSLPAKCRRHFLAMESTGKGWGMMYIKTPKRNWRYPSHTLYAGFYLSTQEKGRTGAYLKAVFERDKWVHVAWVWGMREVPTASGRMPLLCTQLFVNGRCAGRPYAFRRYHPPTDRPTVFYLHGRITAAVDELRISDVQRYTDSFTPPSRGRELKLDKHTRALFHFNGNLKGESFGHSGELPAKLTN